MVKLGCYGHHAGEERVISTALRAVVVAGKEDAGTFIKLGKD